MASSSEQLDSKNNPSYRAIFFDLDGTLLPMEMEDFLRAYYRALGACVAAQGYDPKVFSDALNKGVDAMISHKDGRRNSEVFWETFYSQVDPHAFDWEGVLTDFYENEFGTIGDSVAPNPKANQVVQLLKDKGYPLLLTTMPLFPEVAVDWRLRWADLNPKDFVRITHYENSRAAKPQLAYYQENLKACGLDGTEVLMVGNNTVEDVSISKLGADVFLVTDMLIDDIGFDLSTVKSGSFEEFAAWVETLPNCADPATGIEAGLLDASS